MFNTYFYNSSIRSIIVGFGQLFNDMQIVRLDATEKEIANISVPIAYGNKEKWLTRTTQDSDLSRNVMNVLPRMAFSIIGLKYDPDRKLNANHRVSFASDNANSRSSVPTPVPYNITMKLDVMAKTNNDALQITEQILPYFTPQYNISVMPLPGTDIVQDVPIILTDVSMDDTYATDWNQERYILHTFLFNIKMVIYGGIGLQNIIKNVTTNVQAGQEPLKYNAYINPLDANIGDDYSIVERWYMENDIDKLFGG